MTSRTADRETAAPRELPAEVSAALDRLAAEPGAPAPEAWAVVKKNPARAVYRVPTAAGDLYCKVFPVRTLLDRVKRLGGSRAEREARCLRAVAERGLAVPQAIAWRTAARGSWLATAGIADALKTSDVIRKQLRGPLAGPPRRRRAALLAALGRLARRMHDAGIHHRDLHGSNILVREGAGEPELFLLDLHKARTGAGPVGDRARTDDLGKLMHGMLWDLGAPDLLRLIRAYLPEGDRRARGALLRAALDRAAAIERARLRSRARHAMRRSSGFRTAHRDGRRVFLRRDADEADVLAAADGEARPGLEATSWPDASARAGWLAAIGLGERGLLVPQTVGLVERSGPLGVGTQNSSLVLAAEPARRTLAELVAGAEGGPPARALARAVGRWLARLHAAGVSHRRWRLEGIGVRYPCEEGGGPAGGGPDPDRIGLLLLELEGVRLRDEELAPKDRARALAALDAAAAAAGVSARARVTALLAYATRSRWPGGRRREHRRRLLEAVRAEARS